MRFRVLVELLALEVFFPEGDGVVGQPVIFDAGDVFVGQADVVVGEVGFVGGELGGGVSGGKGFEGEGDCTVSPKCLLTRPPKGWKPLDDGRSLLEDAGELRPPPEGEGFVRGIVVGEAGCVHFGADG